MSKYVYICEDCLLVKKEDFWTCPFCQSGNILEMSVDVTNSKVTFEFTATTLDDKTKLEAIQMLIQEELMANYMSQDVKDFVVDWSSIILKKD